MVGGCSFRYIVNKRDILTLIKKERKLKMLKKCNCGEQMVFWGRHNDTDYYKCPRCLILYGESVKHDDNLVNSLPKDVEKVVINGTTVVVYLQDGSKGKANCDYMDAFDPYVGFVLAYYKAKNGKNFALKGVLKSCIDSAQRKGYKQAILKNYDNNGEKSWSELARKAACKC
jgi:hypothetical protein